MAKTFSSIALYVCFVALSPAGVWISMIGVLLPSSNMRRESWHQSQQVAGRASRTSWLAESSPFRSSFHVRAVELAGAPFHLGHVDDASLHLRLRQFKSGKRTDQKNHLLLILIKIGLHLVMSIATGTGSQHPWVASSWRWMPFHDIPVSLCCSYPFVVTSAATVSLIYLCLFCK